MHRILRETHKKENIDLLKARDVYFSKARFFNKIKGFIAHVPITVSFLVPIFVILNIFLPNTNFIFIVLNFFEHYNKYIVNTLSLFAFFFDFKLSNKISECLSHSNRLRELYDCKVLKIEENPFLYNNLETTVEEDLKSAAKKDDSCKYEVWYRETFSDDDFANALCAMMDNVIYTYHIYGDYSKRLGIRISLLVGLFALYSAFYYSFPAIESCGFMDPILLLFAIFALFRNLFSTYQTSKKLVSTNKNLKESVMEMIKNDDCDGERKNKKSFILRSLQDIIARNRDYSFFVPVSIRNNYLKNDNIYYRELDEFKNLLWSYPNMAKKPRTAKDYEIPTKDGKIFVNLSDIQNKLSNMLFDVKEVLDDANIKFNLDGGTLIGSVREADKSFLAWDDDVDISIKEIDVDKAKKVICEKLGDKYVIQDCYSEKYYSPRLSSFKIRLKNDIEVDEKDSSFCELYDEKGLFIDVYTYCPVVLNKTFDSFYRKFMFYPLYKKIKKIEDKYGITTGDKKVSLEDKFVKLKNRFIKRTKKYLQRAKCEKYYIYVPGYVNDIKKVGPYIKFEDIYGKDNFGEFAGKTFSIPSNYENVLRCYYGENWNISPYKNLEDIKSNGVYKYSSDTFDASCYKHIKNISFVPSDRKK